LKSDVHADGVAQKNQKPGEDVIAERGKPVSDLYHEGKYVILGRGVEFLPLVPIFHKDL
jgi:hypothetical protein